ncbi:hypothetical protein Btru_058350 [Bulinus truncatus]|nr:hypothetical protein Btru_058350 [Bulinus truncatus]
MAVAKSRPSHLRSFKFFLLLLCLWTTVLVGFYGMFRRLGVSRVLEWTALDLVTKPKQECIHPQLLLNDTVMMRHFRRLAPEECPATQEWVYVENGTVRFAASAHSKHRGVSCTYVPIERDGDYHVRWGRPTLNIHDGFRIPGDFFRVYCTSADRKTYNGLFAGVAATEERAQRAGQKLSQGLDGLGIAILGFDSMSRMSWLRRLEKTRAYFHDELGAVELEGHNIVGDGTTAVMFPMLTGKFEWELPEARRFFANATTMDDFPFIWHEFKEAGYLTSWCNADNGSAPFNWRMLGFDEQPTDFYSRPFFMVAKPYLVNKGRTGRVKVKRYCIGSRTYSQVWLNYFRDIFIMYPAKRKFLLHFLVDMSHDDNNLITKMDADIMNVVKFLHDNGYLNNTLLILMGDHGARYDNARGTWAGKMEERLPYFSMLFPQWFQDRYPEAMKNLRANSKRLTTPFDVYETFRSFLNYDGSGKGDLRQRGISLFKEIPLERSCAHACIAAHWCACLDSRSVSLQEDPFARKGLNVAIDTINGFTEQYRNICARLSLHELTDAMKLETRKDVLKFSNTDSVGGIYDIKFNARNRNLMSVYQLTFITVPGMGQFEVTVTHDLLRNNFRLSEKDISRINKYGDDSHCILDKNRQLRQYCFCIKGRNPQSWTLF